MGLLLMPPPFEIIRAVGGGLRLTTLATQFFASCPSRPLHGHAPLPLDKRMELGVSYGVKKVAVAIAQKFKASKL